MPLLPVLHIRRRPVERQRGVAALFMTLAALFLITLVTMFGNKSAIFEQVTSANQYRYTQAFEAAQGGVDYAIAWLGTNGNPNGPPYTIQAGQPDAVWVADASRPPYDQKNIASIPAQTFGTAPEPVYTATITLWRSSTRPRLVEIVAVVTGEAKATVRQVVDVNALGFRTPDLPALVVNGCISNITGTPSIVSGGTSPVAIESSGGPVGPGLCLDAGHFTLTGAVLPNAFTPGPPGGSSAWAQIFGAMTKAEVLILAKAQPGGQTGGPIYYYNNDSPATTAPDPWNLSLGSPSSSVIVIFDRPGADNCPKINGGAVIYGIVYCRVGLDMQGWGGTNIYGPLVTDTDITKYTANTTIHYNANAGLPLSYPVNPVISKLTGTWRDF